MNRGERRKWRGEEGVEEAPPRLWTAYAWAVGGVAAATALFWAARGYLDKEQASLLYLPVVIACATYFGFGPAVLVAAGSFVCWNFFFLPPYGTWEVSDPKDWLALIVFLAVALATARLSAQVRSQAYEARAREREARALQRASEEISGEVSTERILPALARQLVNTCAADYCVIYRSDAHEEGKLTLAAVYPPNAPVESGKEGLLAPLIADNQKRGVLHIGPRRDRKPFSPPQERLILAVANHAAVALARQGLSDEAAQAQALREADSLKNALLSLVSHELRTPLASIKASAGGLLQDGTRWNQAEFVEALQAINDESDRLGQMVSKLLDLSRLEAGAWRPNFDWCDLVDVLGTALARLPEWDGRRVQVFTKPDLPLVRADSVQMAQVMTNLLENALKYAPAGTPILVTLSADNNRVRADVADGGPGVPTDEVEAIFERFHRLPQHRQGGLPGTGLGLAICRGILEAHGGQIWEHNAPSGGAIFSFTLPRPDDVEAQMTLGDTEAARAA